MRFLKLSSESAEHIFKSAALHDENKSAQSKHYNKRNYHDDENGGAGNACVIGLVFNVLAGCRSGNMGGRNGGGC